MIFVGHVLKWFFFSLLARGGLHVSMDCLFFNLPVAHLITDRWKGILSAGMLLVLVHLLSVARKV